MAALTLTVDRYRDRVMGGLVGKSAGLTLGSGSRGKLIPSRNSYYSPVPGQPIASAAMDFPLVWIELLSQVGSTPAPEDLAVAWLEHIDYTQDEFAYAALNLRRGLAPPASGAYGNWFHNATGGLMRADLWASIAPGAPQIAASYAYHDSTLDHSEEGAWAAMALAAMMSAAFFLRDTLTLLTIGLAMIPRTCRTARAVKCALAAAQRGATWLEARESVLNEVGSKNFSDAPQNVGFMTIGLLYGTSDFGAAICATSNCGYDSEVNAGLVGALLGIRDGAALLPTAWTQPIGDIVIPGVGLRDLDTPRTITGAADRVVRIGMQVASRTGSEVAIVEAIEPEVVPELEPSVAVAHEPNPTVEPTIETEVSAPVGADEPPLDEVATSEPTADDAIAAVNASEAASEARVETSASSAASFDPSSVFLAPQPVAEPTAAPMEETVPPQPTIEPALVTPAFDPTTAIAWADSSLVKPLLVTPPFAVVSDAETIRVTMDPGDSPAVAYNTPKSLSFTFTNRGSEQFSGRIDILAPGGWQVTAPSGIGQRQIIAANGGAVRASYTLLVPDNAARILIANTIKARFTPESGSTLEADFLLVGASCWWIVGPFTNYDGEGFDTSYAPEDRPGLRESYLGRTQQMVGWSRATFNEPMLDLEPYFRGAGGVCYGQTILRSPTARDARIVANVNSGVKLWLNGKAIFRRNNRETFRPQLGSGPWAVDVTLQAGDNPLMVKWVRGSEPIQCSITVSDRFGRGLPEVGNTSW